MTGQAEEVKKLNPNCCKFFFNYMVFASCWCESLMILYGGCCSAGLALYVWLSFKGVLNLKLYNHHMIIGNIRFQCDLTHNQLNNPDIRAT